MWHRWESNNEKRISCSYIIFVAVVVVIIIIIIIIVDVAITVVDVFQFWTVHVMFCF